tara:strand:+ start:3486 stop:4220 length:735 start_codon:yes stop_codon:yes gene_type:complete
MNWMSILKKELFIEADENGHFNWSGNASQYVLTNYFNKQLADKILKFLSNKPMYFHKVDPSKGDINNIKSEGQLTVSDPNQGDKAGDNPAAVYTMMNNIFQGYSAPTIGIITNLRPITEGPQYALFHETVPIGNSLIPEFNASSKIPSEIRIITSFWQSNEYNLSITDFPEWKEFIAKVDSLVGESEANIRSWLMDFLPELIKWETRPDYKEPVKSKESIQSGNRLRELLAGKGKAAQKKGDLE